jgi:hypothetical protein
MITRSDGTCIATNIEYADTRFKQSLGLMFRSRIENDYALVFELKEQRVCDVHMLFVPFDIDVLFLDEFRTVFMIDILKAWTGRVKTFNDAKYIIEMKSGSVIEKNISVGDIFIF